MKYIVKTVNNLNWDDIPKAMIDKYVWSDEYTPVAYAQLAILKGRGLCVKLTAFESAPTAVYTQYNDNVYKDSCLEFFASFNPKSNLYMNMELNSNGASLIGIRTDRFNKTPIHELITPPKVTAVKLADRWTVESFLSFEDINTLFGECDFCDGYTFKGNFYKCGDETPIPHYGMWSPVGTPTPDFHRPEYFGEFTVEG